MSYVFKNGEILERSQVTVDIEDRGYQFGDGVYEVIRVYNGKMFTGKEHLQRLLESAEKIGLLIGYSVGEMESFLYQLVEKNGLQLGTIYLQVSRGAAPRNHVFPSAEVKPMFISYTKEVARPVETMEKGVKAILIEDIRWLRCDIKSLNLLGNLLAKQKAAEAGCFEAIQHRGETVTEGSLSNISIVVGGTVKTHPANNLILNGISRQKMLQVCRDHSMAFEEVTYSKEELLNADEVFLTGTTVEVTPIVEVAGSIVGNGAIGPVTKKLQELFKEEIEKECGMIS